MKKLIVKEYMGNTVYEFDVFVEGMDFTFEAPAPTAVWFGKLMLVDKEPEQEIKVEPETFVPIELAIPEICKDCPTWEECQGSNQEDCEHRKEEVSSELTQADNKGTGDAGVGEASEPESIEVVPKSKSKRKATIRIKGYRQP